MLRIDVRELVNREVEDLVHYHDTSRDGHLGTHLCGDKMHGFSYEGVGKDLLEFVHSCKE